MKTLLNTEITDNIKALVYFCKLEGDTIEVRKEVLFEDSYKALELYANTYNPESQIVDGQDHGQFLKNLEKKHKDMNDKEWVKKLGAYL